MAAGAARAVEVEEVRIEIEAAAILVWLAEPIIARDGQDDGLAAVAYPLPQRLKGIAVYAEEAALVEGFGVEAARQEIIRSAKMEALEIGLVSRARDARC